MAVTSSPPISLSDIAAEFGGTAPYSLTDYYGVATGIPTSAPISITDFYGASAKSFSYVGNGTYSSLTRVTSRTFSIGTVPSGSDLLILFNIECGTSASSNFSSCTVDGNSATLVTSSGNGRNTSAIYRISGSYSGTVSVVLNLTGSGAYTILCSVVAVTGYNLASPVGANAALGASLSTTTSTSHTNAVDALTVCVGGGAPGSTTASIANTRASLTTDNNIDLTYGRVISATGTGTSAGSSTTTVTHGGSGVTFRSVASAAFS